MDTQLTFSDYTHTQKSLIDFGMTFDNERKSAKDDTLETND